MGPGFAFKMAISTVALAPASLALAATATAKSGSDRPLVLDAYSPAHTHSSASTPPVSSPSKLARGHLYVATVRGSVSFYEAVDYVALQAPWQIMCGAPQRAPMFGSAGGSGQVGDDAEFIFALPAVGRSCARIRLPRPYTNFQANVGQGWKHPNVLSRQTPARLNRSHTYEFALTGVGEPVSFRLIDPDTRDNYGSFHIYLRDAVPGDCAGGGHLAFGLSRAAFAAGSAVAAGGRWRGGAGGGEELGEFGVHVVVGAAVGASLGSDRERAIEMAAVAAGPREDARDSVGALLELQAFGDVLAPEPRAGGTGKQVEQLAGLGGELAI
jgi:hypothetical protein